MERLVIDKYLVSLDTSPDEADTVAQNIANDIEANKTRLIGFIESLGRYLTDEDSGIRVKALSCVAAVLSNLSTNKLSSRQIAMLSEFLMDRLEDEQCLSESAGGLLALSKMRNISTSTVKSIAQAVFAKVDMKNHNQATRYAVYLVIDGLVNGHIAVLQSINEDAVSGFTRLIAGEKDPRNLMIVFSILKIIIENFEIENAKESLFDASFCYFPITFRPPPDDPYGITSDDLKLKLRDCIAASSLFAEYSFPSLIEKLTSSSTNVKRDTILTIIACIDNYGGVVVESHWEKIYNSVKFEVLHEGEEDIPDLVCKLLRTLTATISSNIAPKVIKDSGLDKFLTAAMGECFPQVTNLESRQAKPAAKLLAAISGGSFAAHDAIAETILPGVFSLVESTSAATIAQQKTALEILALFIEASGSLYGWRTGNASEKSRGNGLLIHKDPLFELFCRALVSTPSEEVSFRLLALQGLVKLALLKEFLDMSELGMIAQYLDDVVLSDTNDSLCESALLSLKDLGNVNPDIILNTVFPTFLSQLPDPEIPPIAQSHSPRKHYRIILSSLADLCVNKAVYEILTVRLLNKLALIAKDGQDVAYAQSILTTILLVIQRKTADKEWDMKFFFLSLTPKLISMTFTASVDRDQPQSRIIAHSSIVAVTSAIVNLLVRSVSEEDQIEFAKQICKIYITNEPSTLIQESDRSRIASATQPLDKGFGTEGLVEIFTAAVAGLRRETAFPHPDVLSIASNLIPVALSTRNIPDRLALDRLIALLVNKWLSKDDEDRFVNSAVEELKSRATGSKSMADRASSLELLAWVGKSLIFKGSRRAYETVDLVLQLLCDEYIGKGATKACGILISGDEIVNKSNFVVVRLLAKQQYFGYCVQRIVEGFNSSIDSETKRNHLIGLSNILQHIPGKIVIPHLPSFLPLLLQSLSLSDSHVKLATIETITATLSDASDLISEHISTILPHILDSTADKASNPPKVRVAALNCLAVLPRALPGEVVQPYRTEIIRRLAVALDDSRRAVRKAAVDCRQTYFAMDG
ncbi:Dos2-interacting transcription regulator of RNA-Pol-II-domain-containing protein [Lipomyces tetrasporus]|uniref:MMS19 nucleotide excision repair protein n=1 Tax=Lipomyces tetrasporus TaxID=54092 RepID=A0AAD7VRP9_9ASCO|nr:Dos2-interacting transcription regulator of RNA-Pol-II-domain-containing protein [Lipomyces tetrasporus]KAJ8098350.1 Dos2-interacting transcription regulator of RNA-Pol-II-domain-containing protein [Lipomyces tetrasporus]